MDAHPISSRTTLENVILEATAYEQIEGSAHADNMGTYFDLDNLLARRNMIQQLYDMAAFRLDSFLAQDAKKQDTQLAKEKFGEGRSNESSSLASILDFELQGEEEVEDSLKIMQMRYALPNQISYPGFSDALKQPSLVEQIMFVVCQAILEKSKLVQYNHSRQEVSADPLAQQHQFCDCIIEAAQVIDLSIASKIDKFKPRTKVKFEVDESIFPPSQGYGWMPKMFEALFDGDKYVITDSDVKLLGRLFFQKLIQIHAPQDLWSIIEKVIKAHVDLTDDLEILKLQDSAIFPYREVKQKIEVTILKQLIDQYERSLEQKQSIDLLLANMKNVYEDEIIQKIGESIQKEANSLFAAAEPLDLQFLFADLILTDIRPRIKLIFAEIEEDIRFLNLASVVEGLPKEKVLGTKAKHAKELMSYQNQVIIKNMSNKDLDRFHRQIRESIIEGSNTSDLDIFPEEEPCQILLEVLGAVLADQIEQNPDLSVALKNLRASIHRTSDGVSVVDFDEETKMNETLFEVEAVYGSLKTITELPKQPQSCVFLQNFDNYLVRLSHNNPFKKQFSYEHKKAICLFHFWKKFKGVVKRSLRHYMMSKLLLHLYPCEQISFSKAVLTEFYSNEMQDQHANFVKSRGVIQAIAQSSSSGSGGTYVDQFSPLGIFNLHFLDLRMNYATILNNNKDSFCPILKKLNQVYQNQGAFLPVNQVDETFDEGLTRADELSENVTRAALQKLEHITEQNEGKLPFLRLEKVSGDLATSNVTLIIPPFLSERKDLKNDVLLIKEVEAYLNEHRQMDQQIYAVGWAAKQLSDLKNASDQARKNLVNTTEGSIPVVGPVFKYGKFVVQSSVSAFNVKNLAKLNAVQAGQFLACTLALRQPFLCQSFTIIASSLGTALALSCLETLHEFFNGDPNLDLVTDLVLIDGVSIVSEKAKMKRVLKNTVSGKIYNIHHVPKQYRCPSKSCWIVDAELKDSPLLADESDLVHNFNWNETGKKMTYKEVFERINLN